MSMARLYTKSAKEVQTVGTLSIYPPKVQTIADD